MAEVVAGRSDLPRAKLPVPQASEEGYFVKVVGGDWTAMPADPAGMTAAGAALADEIAAASGASTAEKLRTKMPAGTTDAAGKVQLAVTGIESASKAPKATGADLAALLAAGGYSLSPATGDANLDNIADGTSRKAVTASEKTALAAGYANLSNLATAEALVQAPWAVPTIYAPDSDRARLERASGGRATIFYSADGLRTPCQAVWLDAYAMADVSPDFSRARANSTAYAIGTCLIANGQLYEVTTAGTTGSGAPTYGTNVGDTVTDGTAVLTLRANSYNDIHPAFSVAGTKKSGLWIGRFQAGYTSGKVRCVSGQIPQSVTIDNMRAYCAAFGGSCRPMTGWDWSAIWLDAVRKGIVPVGNTDYGRSHKSTEKQWGGVRGDSARPGDTTETSNPYTRGGTGGKLWTHNREEWGVADFVGNMQQWVDGYKLMDGQLYVAAYDNDATLLSAVGESSWIPTGIFFDSPAAGDDSGASSIGTPRLDAAVTNYTASVTAPRDTATIQADTRDLDYASATWSAYGVQAGYDAVAFAGRLAAFRLGISPKIRSAGASPLSASEGLGYMRNNGERFAFRGGRYSLGSTAGPACCLFSSRRSGTYAFRPVFVP